MYATTATCTECNGEGERESAFLTGLVRATDNGADPVMYDCDHCSGTGECDCDECINTASENAFSDMCESEPPLSADERHQMAWQQKQELRR